MPPSSLDTAAIRRLWIELWKADELIGAVIKMLG